MIGKSLIAAAGNGISTGDVAEAIDFDGTNDSLIATSLTGAADSKTFTLSAWVWLNSVAQPNLGATIYTAGRNNLGTHNFQAYVTSDGNLELRARVDGGTTFILQVTVPIGTVPKSTFMHVLVSFDMANTANRYVYINDVAVTPTYTTYTNTNLLFATNTFRQVVGSSWTFNTVNDSSNGRLSNVYLDYTYRNLSIEANRRLFVTADLKPADGQASLNPILYLPMSDPTAPGANAGTGGDFTLTGTVARSGRGPNQYNAPYSDLDGSADFLERTSALTGIADGKMFTFQCVFNTDVTTIGKTIFTIANSTTARFYLQLSAGPGINMDAYNSSGTRILESQIRLPGFTSFVPGRNYVLTVSIDLANTANRHVYVNGQAAGMNWYTYTNDNIDFLTATPRCYVGQTSTNTLRWDGDLGAVWFNTSYIDLSVPANLAKFVTGTGIDAKPVDPGATGELPTGTSPLIYLPMYGNNAGRNYGTGGAFTVNSGPYTGARGPNEFWGNKANFNGTNSSLRKTSALTGITDTKTVSCSFWVNPGAISGGESWLFMLNSGAGSQRGFQISFSNTIWRFFAYNSAGTQILGSTASTSYGAGEPYFVQISVDLSNSAKRRIYINGVLDSTSWSPYTNDTISYTTANDIYIASDNSSQFVPGALSELYVTNEYIDFTLEANRLKFRDAFGNPVDLTQQIEDGAIPNPAIYMRFPPTAFGTNYGTGGDFSISGTLTDGGQL